MRNQRKDAEILALQALGWIMSHEDLASAWLAASGASTDSLRARAADPEFLAGLLDFLLSSDALVTGFASDAGIAPADLLGARRHLPGGTEIDWG